MPAIDPSGPCSPMADPTTQTAPMTPMSREAVASALEALPDWQLDTSQGADALTRTTTFATFLTAIAFVNALAHAAERQDHHPDIAIRYHRVTLRYWTHRAKGVTALDFKGAQEAEGLIDAFQKRGLQPPE